MSSFNNPQISIVLPTYNGKRFLALAIESILEQSFTDFELIIVDDCSTDSTPGIIDKFIKLDKRIKVIRNLKNSKLPASLNVGFENAKGNYYTWTSDDNLLHQDFLKVHYNTLIRDNAIDITYSNYTNIDDSGKKLNIRKLPPIEEIYRTNCIGASFMYKKDVHIKLNGYDEKHFLMEDYDFWLRAYKYFKYKLIEEELYFYRFHTNSLTNQYQEKIRNAHSKTIERNIKYLKNLPLKNTMKLYSNICENNKGNLKYYYFKFKCLINIFKFKSLSDKKFYLKTLVFPRVTKFYSAILVNNK